MTRGERLKLALVRAGMSAEAMGRALDLTGAAVRQWTNNRSDPGVDELARFAELTGASLLWLASGDEAPAELADWAVAFADLVASGVEPAQALDSVSGGAAALSASEALLLADAAEGMRAVLDELAPAPWRQLTLSQKRQVLRLVERLAEESRRGRLLRRRRRIGDE